MTEQEQEQILFVLPQNATHQKGHDLESTISRDLYNLTYLLSHQVEIPQGFLGGTYGYGADFENDTFRMYPYCWCEKEDCPWCSGCTCPDSAYHYHIDKREVSFEEWYRYYDYNVPNVQNPNWERISQEVNTHRTSTHDAICSHCTKGGPEGKPPGHSAPNFWHKPSGLKIWWYKYIGRGMEQIPKVTLPQWGKIYFECLTSIQEG
ncbi:hypothetical protein LCGC14_1790990 [marine sediment metagenome]|uniref:Uncharacterized protein n=1 Tax=marine sediment metagenome TaxID=412755 RepID=A0A0F9GSL7_9ZZZZ